MASQRVNGRCPPAPRRESTPPSGARPGCSGCAWPAVVTTASLSSWFTRLLDGVLARWRADPRGPRPPCWRAAAAAGALGAREGRRTSERWELGAGWQPGRLKQPCRRGVPREPGAGEGAGTGAGAGSDGRRRGKVSELLPLLGAGAGVSASAPAGGPSDGPWATPPAEPGAGGGAGVGVSGRRALDLLAPSLGLGALVFASAVRRPSGFVWASAVPAASPATRQKAREIRRYARVSRCPERTKAATRRGQLITVECIILTSARGAALFLKPRSTAERRSPLQPRFGLNRSNCQIQVTLLH